MRLVDFKQLKAAPQESLQDKLQQDLHAVMQLKLF